LPRYFRHPSPLATDTDRDGCQTASSAIARGRASTSKDTDRDGRLGRQGGSRRRPADEPRRVPVRDAPPEADSDADGTTDDLEDPDRDGLWNWSEPRAVVHPRKADTDGDRISDAKEDRDKDGLSNLNEQNRGTHPNKVDTDGDGFTDRARSWPARIRAIRRAIHRPTRRRADPARRAGLPVFPRPTSGTSASTPARRRPLGHLIATIGLDRGLHMDFGSYAGYGIPINCRVGRHAATTVAFEYDDESDHVGYPIPSSPKIEAGDGTETRRPHILMLDKDACRPTTSCSPTHGHPWRMVGRLGRDVGPAFERPADRRLDQRRRGRLPILPGLVRYDEGRRGRDRPRASLHDEPHTEGTHLSGAPRREQLDRCGAAADGSARPSRGVVRHVRVLAAGPGHRRALKRYGMILATTVRPGTSAGQSDSRFDDDVLHELDVITGRDLEVVDTSGLVNGP
jgi:hypothetical protein